MFDAIAPRYDLVNRVMTFRLDVRWRRRDRRDARPAARLDGARPGVGHRRPVHRPAQGRAPADLGRPVVRDARRRPHRRAPGAGRHPAAAGARRVGRRRDVRVRAAQPHRAARRSSTSWRGWCGRAGGSRCSTSASRATGSSAGATTSTSARSCPKIGGLLSRRRGVPIPAEVASPTCRAGTTMVVDAPRGRVHDASRTLAVGRHHPAADGDPAADDERAVTPSPLERDVDLNDVARGDGYLFVREGVGLAGRGVAARAASTRRVGVPRRDRARRRRRRSTARARSPSARCRSCRARRRARRPLGRGRQGRRRAARGSPGSTAPTSRLLDRAASRRRRRRRTRCARLSTSTTTWPPSPPAATPCAPARLTKA